MFAAYYLDPEGNPIPCDPASAHIVFSEDRRIALTLLSDGTSISTVFLCYDHQYGSGPPLLFETLAQGPNDTEGISRYPTWEDALLGHRQTVAFLLNESPTLTVTSDEQREKPRADLPVTMWARLSCENGL